MLRITYIFKYLLRVKLFLKHLLTASHNLFMELVSNGVSQQLGCKTIGFFSILKIFFFSYFLSFSKLNNKFCRSDALGLRVNPKTRLKG